MFNTLLEINNFYEEDKKGFGSLSWIKVDIYEEEGILKFTPDK